MPEFPLFAIKTAQILAPTTSFLGAGCYFCASHLTIPLLVNLPIGSSTTAFAALFYSGAVIQVPLNVISSITSGFLSYALPSSRNAYATAGISTIMTMVFTRLVMMGPIQRLLHLSQSPAARENAAPALVQQLITTWQTQNYFRAGFALIGGLWCLWPLVNA